MLRVDAKLEERGERIRRRRKEEGEGRRKGRRGERRGEGAARAGAELLSQVLRLVQVKARARVVGIEYPQHQTLVSEKHLIFSFFARSSNVNFAHTAHTLASSTKWTDFLNHVDLPFMNHLLLSQLFLKHINCSLGGLPM